MEYSHTYTIYMLVENDVPYYVGCSLQGIWRYSGQTRKKSHFEILEETKDNLEARFLEQHWIEVLRSWGFVLKNSKRYAPYPLFDRASKVTTLQLNKR